MKLLLDENLSRRLVPFLQTNYPGSSQVALLGLEKESDQHIWNYAKGHNFIIVSRDSDFHEMSLLRGAPPKVIWLKTGNQSKAAVLNTLVSNYSLIEKVLLDLGKNCIEIYF